MNKRLFVLAGASLLTLGLAACSGANTEELDAWMREAGSGLKGHVDPVPQVLPYHPEIYGNPANLLAPFDPQKLLQGRRQGLPNAPDFNRPREALENYELDKLHMVGTLKRGGITYGLVRTPEGTIIRVHPGNFMGINFGQINKITESEIQLTETVEDLNGNWVQHVASIPLEEQGQK